MKSTMAQRITEEMQQAGHELLGRTSGTLSFRKGSNLIRYLDHLGKTEDEVIVRAAARAGRRLNDGYQLLVFSKK